MSRRPSDRLKLQHRFQPLRRASKWPVWADVTARLGLAFLLIAFVVLVHWIDRAGLKDSHDGHISFLDVVYFTMISVTTTGFGDIAPVSDRSRLIEALIVTPIRIAVLFIFVGTAYSFVIKRTWEKWRMARIQAKLTDHIVVLGFGVSGGEAVHELIARGTDPACIVVIDPSRQRIDAAEAMGCNVLEGDASSDETLLDVRIAQARSVLVSAGRDDTSILIVLTVRHLAPQVPISVVIRTQDNELLARQAGANDVINPVSFTGLLLAGSAQGAHIADYMADLASVSGKVQLNERPVHPEEIGKSIDELASGGRGLRIYRGGQPIGFWEAGAKSLQSGDILVEVIPCEACEAD
ncbi:MULTISPECIES: TrkA family potassium uptake protein [Sphingopyxis]|jgi:voltage-gated potassium channel|uniref:potassium channel family protein n=1 Tax=Sphingopyxis TaxID=165697 RepID=UPI001648B462|nr:MULTISPECIES: potassium channel family protein [Sphingopyxis]MBD3747514.1 potassium channel family protein [Sphingopyxis terrae]QXF11667.1 potassium channel family protein [Sphingopyxis terrae subsp. terrae]